MPRQLSLSPINTLPPEILTQIFTLCLPFDTVICTTTAPLLFTRVCRYWREITLTTPHLWSTVVLNDALKPSWIPLVKAFLLCSGELPLNITFYSCLYRLFPRQTHSLLGCLITHSPRWHDVYLHLPPGSHNVFFKRLERSHHQLSMLESLSLSTYAEKDFHIGRKLSSMLRSASRLRRLSWTDPTSGFQSLQLQSCSKTLTSLELELNMLTICQCINIMGSCPELRECSVGRLTGGLVEPITDLDHVILPHLTSFYISAYDSLTGLFNNLTLPTLRTFSAHTKRDDEEEEDEGWEWDEPAWPGKEFAAMLWRSGCPLEALIFNVLGLLEDDLITALEPVEHSLAHLTVLNPSQYPSVQQRILEMWTCTGAGSKALNLGSNNSSCAPCFCPRLESLELNDCIHAPAGALARLVKSRTSVVVAAGMVPLERMSVLGPHSEDYRMIRKLMKAGALRTEFRCTLSSF